MLVNAKQISELANFTSDDNTRPSLMCVCVKQGEMVATSGHVLAIIRTALNDSDDNFPFSGREFTGTIDNEKPILLKPEQLRQAYTQVPKKTVLPVLQNLQIGTSDGKPVINAGLPVIQIPIDTDQSMQYPNYNQVIPDYKDKKPVRFSLDGAILKKICDMAIKHGTRENHKIVFEIPTVEKKVKVDENGNTVYYDSGTPVMELQTIKKFTNAVKFEIKNDDTGLDCSGLIMPLRLED